MPKLEVGKNDLETWCKQNNKEYLLDEWNYEKNSSLSTSSISHSSSERVWWKCKKCGYEWCTSIRHRAIENTGCRECSKIKVGEKNRKNAILKNNSLQITRPELLKEWNYEKNTILPSEVTEGSNLKVWWKCKLGHEWESKIGNRTILNRNCPYCAGSKTLKGFNDFESAGDFF